MKLRIALATTAIALLAVPAALADADFTDPAGDGGGAPDVTDISVFNDAGNRVIFGAKIAGGKAMAADGEVVFVLDTDKNPDTGNNGWDYLVVLNGAKQWDLLSWNGTEWVEATANTVKAYFYDDVVMLAVDRAEIGNTASFDFFVEANQYSGDQILATDTAPDGDAVWSYATVTKTLGVTATAIVGVTKGGAKQGKTFLAGYLYARTDSPEPAAGAKTTCTATVGAKRIPARVGTSPEAAACTVTLPKKSKGKVLKLTMKTTYAGKSVTRSYSTKVKA